MAKKYLDGDGLLYFWQKIKSAFVTDVTYDSTNKKIQKSKNGSTSDVVTLATVATSGSYNDLSNKPTIPSGVQPTTTTPKMDGTAAVGSETKYAKGDHVHPTDTSRQKDLGIDSVGTTTVQSLEYYSITDTNSDSVLLPTSNALSALMTQLNAVIADKIDCSAKGAADGVAPLNLNAKIPSEYLPSYVDDVIEAYPVSGATALSAGWLSETSGGSALTPEAGKIYVLMADSGDYSANTQFRWGGSAYVKLNDGGVSSITNAEIDTIVAS